MKRMASAEQSFPKKYVHMSPAFGEGSAVRTIVTMDGNGRLAIDLRHQGEGIGAMLLKGTAERA